MLLALLVRISDAGARQLGEVPDTLTIGERFAARRAAPARARRGEATGGSDVVNKQIRRLALALIVCYVILFVQLNVLQVRRAESLNADLRNQRQTERDFNRPRGPIVTADGVVIAQSVPTQPGDQFKFQRAYPAADLFSNITGYYTFAFGSTELERTQNDVLMGDTAEQQLRALPDLFSGEDNTGSVQLTMRDDVQQVAKVALGGREGSVVVMDPKTGAVMAMVSYPSFDANKVAVHNFSQANAYLQELNAAPGKPLLNNAYQERYMPGSTFKVLTTSIGLENGVINMDDTTFPIETEFTPPQTTDPIQNFEGERCGGTLPEVFARSCNIPFAQIALALGPQRMVDGANKWGVGEKLPVDLPAPAASFFGDVDDFTDNLPLLAIGGFGQGNDQMVPLHMAMVASTVANGGEMMKPYVIDETLDHDGVAAEHHPAVGVEDPDPAVDRGRPDDADDRRGQHRAPAGRCSWPTGSRPRRRPAPRSSTRPASRSSRTPGSSASPRPRTRSTRSP